MPKTYRTPKWTLLKLLKWAQEREFSIRIGSTGLTSIYDAKTGLSYGGPTVYRALKQAKYTVEKENEEKKVSVENVA